MLNMILGLFVLGILVFIHELGHYLAAKYCNPYFLRYEAIPYSTDFKSSSREMPFLSAAASILEIVSAFF